MKKYLFSIFIFYSLFSQSQNPLVKQWDYRYGGTNDEVLYCIQATRDGGYILGGYSGSGISGDKTQASQGGSDYWIVKLNSIGIKQWDRTFGGAGNDVLSSLQQATDGGYILGGTSQSGIGGDKSQPLQGGYDYWVVRVDSTGAKQWDKDFGSTGDDFFYSVKQAADGGYILGGASSSGIGGDKTQPSQGFTDYWVVKVDSTGTKQWDKDFGGPDWDFLYSIDQVTGGGFLLGGYSLSGIGGDKTQPSRGGSDYWILKIDSAGSKQWDRGFGGTGDDILYSLKQTADSGYILGGLSLSAASGDKSQNNWGGYDYWMIKTDNAGIKQWDKDFGGTAHEDLFGNISQTTDGGYLLAGTSYSNISGDKTESNSLNSEQTWIVKTDLYGTKQWDKTILTPGHDEEGFAIQTSDGCYATASTDDGTQGGYKSQPAWSLYPDFWIVKFCDSTTVPAAAFTVPNLICPGSCISFLNLSSNATTYQWSFPFATPDTSSDVNPTNICYANPGSYNVQLIATNANGSDTLLLPNYIIVYPTPPPQSITQNGDTLFAVAGAASYQWYFNTTIINGATNYFYVAPASGDYNVVATDANGCEVEAAVFNVIAGLTLTLSKGGGITAEPNPFSDKITIHFLSPQNSTAHLKIFNSIGEAVLEKEIRLEDQTLNLAALPQGIYLVSALSEGRVYNQKIVK